MDPKPRPNDDAYLRVLRAMTPGQRAQKAFEMSDFTKSIFKDGLRRRFPELSEDRIHQIFLDELAKCHNSNY